MLSEVMKLTSTVLARNVCLNFFFLYFKKPHQTFLDSMTLAVFEDSGWYKVNYDYAEDLPWAANQGCTYGLTEVCDGKETELFCNTR